MSQWVQHMSGQGEKWEVDCCLSNAVWRVHTRDTTITVFHYLPVSEYILCDPPEQWQDVTESLTMEETMWGLPRLKYPDGAVADNTNHRFRKVEINLVGPGILNGCQKGWAFIVEKRKS